MLPATGIRTRFSFDVLSVYKPDVELATAVSCRELIGLFQNVEKPRVEGGPGPNADEMILVNAIFDLSGPEGAPTDLLLAAVTLNHKQVAFSQSEPVNLAVEQFDLMHVI